MGAGLIQFCSLSEPHLLRTQPHTKHIYGERRGFTATLGPSAQAPKHHCACLLPAGRSVVRFLLSQAPSQKKTQATSASAFRCPQTSPVVFLLLPRELGPGWVHSDAPSLPKPLSLSLLSPNQTELPGELPWHSRIFLKSYFLQHQLLI